MFGIQNIVFILLLAVATVLFIKNVRKIARNIRLGREIKRNDQKAARWKIMAKVALGQQKMTTRPIAALLHLFVYVGFVIINIEVLEILLDGILGTHRIFAPILGNFYNFLIGSFEILALLVLIGVVVFMIRRNILNIKRFQQSDLDGWPKSDANYILIAEIFLMSAFLLMNAADAALQEKSVSHYIQAGSFPISSFIKPLLDNCSTSFLIIFERFLWWFHIIGILVFLNYLPYSKHFHIILAFPNVWYSNLDSKGRFGNMESVKNEVKLMLDPTAVVPENPLPEKFGAKDVQDLTWKNLLDAYTCTECGRCTSECPANITGKKLSPRSIMMKTRDRLEEVGKNLDKNKGVFLPDGKSLLHDHITPEELWACTSCNACVQACPVNIDPLSVIIDLRRQLVMEESNPPSSLGSMFNNVQNNGAPWQFSPADRLNWTE